MQEIEFIINFEKNQIEFSNGVVCEINNNTDSFIYEGNIFAMESDIEKDLQNAFGERFVNVTDYSI